MAVKQHRRSFRRLSEADLAPWAGAEAAQVSDCLERSQAMAGAIGPVAPGMRLLGQARTVRCMVGDNSALHAAITVARPGEVLVADAQGFEDVAVWGGLMTRAALERKLGGLVLDGALRDVDEIARLGFSCFARRAAPRGPHKGFGGEIDGVLACAGVQVAPGDLVIGDADGVTIVPMARLDATLKALSALKEREAAAIARMKTGASLAEIYSVPEIEMVETDEDGGL